MRSRKYIYTRILATITALTLFVSVPIGSVQASAETQSVSQTSLLFEDKFDSYFNYNWTMTSRDIGNNEETDYNWASNYKKQIKTGGVSESCMSVTRNGLGYVSLDTALFPAEGGALYSLNYFLRVENAVYDITALQKRLVLSGEFRLLICMDRRSNPTRQCIRLSNLN